MRIALGLALENRDLFAILSVIISIGSFISSLLIYRQARSLALYSDIDRLYLELLKLGMQNPSFVDPDKTRDYVKSFPDPDKRTQYELYAFMVWNLCETVVDRQDNKLTFDSWEPVLEHESNLHRAWFEKEENRKKFKSEFKAYMDRRKIQLNS